MRAISPRIQAVFQDVFDDDDLMLTEATTAADVENWDSLTHIDLIYGIEKKFGITFSTREVQSLKNVGELQMLIEKKTGAAG